LEFFKGDEVEFEESYGCHTLRMIVNDVSEVDEFILFDVDFVETIEDSFVDFFGLL